MLRSSSLAVPLICAGQFRFWECCGFSAANVLIECAGEQPLYDTSNSNAGELSSNLLPFAGRTNSILYEFCFHPVEALRAELPDMV